MSNVRVDYIVRLTTPSNGEYDEWECSISYLSTNIGGGWNILTLEVLAGPELPLFVAGHNEHFIVEITRKPEEGCEQEAPPLFHGKALLMANWSADAVAAYPSLRIEPEGADAKKWRERTNAQ